MSGECTGLSTFLKFALVRPFVLYLLEWMRLADDLGASQERIGYAGGPICLQ